MEKFFKVGRCRTALSAAASWRPRTLRCKWTRERVPFIVPPPKTPGGWRTSDLVRATRWCHVFLLSTCSSAQQRDGGHGTVPGRHRSRLLHSDEVDLELESVAKTVLMIWSHGRIPFLAPTSPEQPAGLKDKAAREQKPLIRASRTTPRTTERMKCVSRGPRTSVVSDAVQSHRRWRGRKHVAAGV
jgi:hypothetical protein